MDDTKFSNFCFYGSGQAVLYGGAVCISVLPSLLFWKILALLGVKGLIFAKRIIDSLTMCLKVAELML